MKMTAEQLVEMLLDQYTAAKKEYGLTSDQADHAAIAFLHASRAYRASLENAQKQSNAA